MTGTKQRPTYDLKRVGDELPPAPKRAGGATLDKLFRDSLEAISEEPGVWFELVTYSTPTTAKTTAKRLVEAIQSGTLAGVGDYEFEPRRAGTGSALFARAIGNSQAEVPASGDPGDADVE